MSKTFASMKKQSGAAALKALVEKTKNLNKNSYSSSDDRFWEATTDKSGSGYATVRFLPEPKNEDVPFVRFFRHAFKGPKTGKWYINNSLTSVGKEDPVGDYNRQLWNSNLEENIAFVREHSKRKTIYVSNILVIDDPAKPENNGKVMLFRYGKKIMDKIQLALGFDEKGEPIPGIPEEDFVNVFDLDVGANFNFKIRKVKGYNNYDMCSFASRTPLADGDAEKQNEIWEKEFSLFQFIDPDDADAYPTYDHLQKRLIEVLDLDSSETPELEQSHASLMSKYETSSTEESPEIPETDVSEEESSDDDNDDTMAFFEKLKDA